MNRALKDQQALVLLSTSCTSVKIEWDYMKVLESCMSKSRANVQGAQEHDWSTTQTDLVKATRAEIESLNPYSTTFKSQFQIMFINNKCLLIFSAQKERDFYVGTKSMSKA